MSQKDENGIPLKEECLTCINEITERAMEMFQELQISMKEEFKTTLAHFRDQISMSVAEMEGKVEKEKHELKTEIKEDQKKADGLIKFIMSICLALVVACVGGVAYNAGQIAGKADKEELKQYVTASTLVDILSVREGYFRSIFLLDPKSNVDSTQFHWIVNTLLDRGSRSAIVIKEEKPHTDKSK
jgi:gas vesicle protein